MRRLALLLPSHLPFLLGLRGTSALFFFFAPKVAECGDSCRALQTPTAAGPAQRRFAPAYFTHLSGLGWVGRLPLFLEALKARGRGAVGVSLREFKDPASSAEG